MRVCAERPDIEDILQTSEEELKAKWKEQRQAPTLSKLTKLIARTITKVPIEIVERTLSQI